MEKTLNSTITHFIAAAVFVSGQLCLMPSISMAGIIELDCGRTDASGLSEIMIELNSASSGVDYNAFNVSLYGVEFNDQTAGSGAPVQTEEQKENYSSYSICLNDSKTQATNIIRLDDFQTCYQTRGQHRAGITIFKTPVKDCSISKPDQSEMIRYLACRCHRKISMTHFR